MSDMLAQIIASVPYEITGAYVVANGNGITLPSGDRVSFQTVLLWTEPQRNAQSIYTVNLDTTPPGKYMVSYTLSWTGSAVNQIGTFADIPPTTATPYQGVLFSLRPANLNTTTDQIFVRSPAAGTFTNFTIDQILIGEASVNLTNVVGGVYTAVSKGGVAVVAASQTFKSVTTSTKAASAPLTTAGGDTRNTDLWLSLTTPQGTAATATIVVKGTIWS